VFGLAAHETATPLRSGIVELGHHVFLEGLQFGDILLWDVGDASGSAGLLTDELTESGLGLNDAVWDVHFLAESWQPADDFDWVDVVSDDNEVGLLLLDQVSDVIETELDDWDDLGVPLLFGESLKTILLFNLSLWLDLLAQTGQLRDLISGESVGELSNGWRNLDSLHEDSLLSLKSDILWPFGESGKITLWLDVTPDTEGTSLLFEEAVLLHLSWGISTEWSSWQLFLLLRLLLKLLLWHFELRTNIKYSVP